MQSFSFLVDFKRQKKNSKLAIAVCAQIKVKAGSREIIEFCLVWNMPNISFAGNQKQYKR